MPGFALPNDSQGNKFPFFHSLPCVLLPKIGNCPMQKAPLPPAPRSPLGVSSWGCHGAGGGLGWQRHTGMAGGR